MILNNSLQHKKRKQNDFYLNYPDDMTRPVKFVNIYKLNEEFSLNKKKTENLKTMKNPVWYFHKTKVYEWEEEEMN